MNARVMKKVKIKTTVSIIALLFLSYVILSRDYVYIPWEYLKDFGFLISNPLTLFTYPFIHISPSHLLSNILLLLAIGFIAEQKISSKEYFVVFFSSAIVSAIVFSIAAPNIILVGASAAISGILAVSFFVDFKKTLIGVAIFALTLPMLTSVVNNQVQSYYSSTVLKNQELKHKVTNIEQQVKKALEANNTTLVKKLSAEKEKLQSNEKKTEEIRRTIEEGREREKGSIVMQIVHVAGALTGVAFLFIFRRDILMSLPEQFDLARAKQFFNKWKQ